MVHVLTYCMCVNEPASGKRLLDRALRKNKREERDRESETSCNSPPSCKCPQRNTTLDFGRNSPLMQRHTADVSGPRLMLAAHR